MFRRKRITRYYVIEQQGKHVFVSHQPQWLFYFADNRTFFAQRQEAYRKLAALLGDPRFWKSATGVTSRSLTIDFSRETLPAELAPLAWYDKPGLVMLWLLNVYNWRISRMKKLVRILQAKRVSRFLVDRETFRGFYEGR